MTRRQHLSKLPLQKRLQAMENIRKLGSFCTLDYTPIDNGELILSGLFIFGRTRQGHDYWIEIDKKYFG